MSVEIEKIGAVRTKITLTIDAETVKKEMEKVYKKFQREASIPGFRPGKAPMGMLKRRFGHYAEQETKNNLLTDRLPKVLEENKINILGAPELEKDQFNEDGSLTVIAIMDTEPQVELGEYKGMEIAVEPAVVKPEEIESQLEYLRQNLSTTKEIEDRAVAQNGDLVRVDFEGKKDGQPFKGGKAENHMMELGRNTFIPGFEEAVVGMSKGETKVVNLNFPADYFHKELAGKAVEFTIKLNALLIKELPVLDDEFAKDTGMAENLEALRQKLNEDLQYAAEDRRKHQIRQQMMDHLVEKHPIEVPQALVDRQIEYEARRFKSSLAQAGLPLPQGAEAEDKLRSHVAERAKKGVQTAFIIEAVAKAEKLEVVDADLENELLRLATEQGRPVAEISAYVQKEKLVDALRERLLEDKVVDFLLSNAKIIDKEPIQPTETASNSEPEKNKADSQAE